MRSYGLGVLVMAVVTMPLGAWAPADSDEPMRVGPGVTPPRLIHKVEPEYSPEARAAHVQGTIILQIIVTGKGRPADITVISPLGFGLDERAVAAVSTWEFVPGMHEGVPVSILATVNVNFRFPGRWFDEKAERRRTAFNVALQTLNRPNATPAAVDRAVKSMTDLSRQKFAPAMHVVGSWKLDGEHGAQDVAAGLDLVQQAAAKHHGPALYEIGRRRIDGRGLPRDVEKGLEEMRNAAVLGSRQAQFYLGNRYEVGEGVPREPDRARRYFRLCATQGEALCQYRLGRLLFNAPDRRERDYLQAVALFQLAAEQKLAAAKPPAESETKRLSAEQSAWVASLKQQIVRK